MSGLERGRRKSTERQLADVLLYRMYGSVRGALSDGCPYRDRIFRTLCLVACRQIWWWSSVSLLARCGGERPFLRPLCIAAAVITRIGPETCDPAFAAEPGVGEPRIRNQRRRSIKNPGTWVTRAVVSRERHSCFASIR